VRFDDAAHSDFRDWRSDLEARLRRGELSPAMEGHLAKYRKLVPALALINHIADRGDGQVSHKAMLKALSFARYLESHARRVYGAHNTIDIGTAKAILAHIRNGDIKETPFTARDIHQRDWSGLTDRAHVRLALDLLVEFGYLASLPSVVSERGFEGFEGEGCTRFSEKTERGRKRPPRGRANSSSMRKRRYRQRLRDGVIVIGVPVTNE